LRDNYNMEKIKVLLVDDHDVVREGMRSLLTGESDIELAGEAGDGREAVRLAEKLSPDIVVMDVVMPLLNGLEATREMLGQPRPPRILILSSYSDESCVKPLLEAGVMGYLVKSTAALELLSAIRAIHAGQTFFSPAVAATCKMLTPDAPRKPAGRRKTKGLTPRESEVLQLIAEGHPNKSIAGELGVAMKTIEKHRQSLMAKLDIHDIAGLTRYAFSKRIIP
jgi:DNA-binding NarL/FixJ family response regulator